MENDSAGNYPVLGDYIETSLITNHDRFCGLLFLLGIYFHFYIISNNEAIERLVGFIFQCIFLHSNSSNKRGFDTERNIIDHQGNS